MDYAKTLVSRDRLICITTQRQRFVSWRPDPEACAVDAFTIDWGTQLNYAFPPFTLITGLPVWQTQSESALHFVVFSVSVKVLPVTPLLSGVFVHRAFYAYFLRIERVVGNA